MRGSVATDIFEKLTKEFNMLEFLGKQVLGIFYVWQLFAFVVLIALLIFWKVYRNKQM